LPKRQPFVVLLPDVPGAKYIGSKECEQCHDKIYRDFATADHARLIAEGPMHSTRVANPATDPAACILNPGEKSSRPIVLRLDGRR